jgi:hypothetical protein
MAVPLFDAATIVIPIARPFTMTSAIVYALPARACYFIDTGAGGVETSPDGVTWVAVGTDRVVAGSFARSAGCDSVITIKPM